MAREYLDDIFTTQPCISLESLDYTYSYNGYTSKEIQGMYEKEKHLADLLLNVSSAFKLELHFRNKRFQLMTNDKKYRFETLIGNAGIKVDFNN